ncbi:MAG: hypothetical protein GY796_35950 [Chloroflexi bacterium]|nr:hypothetical protein [Chloroflexota bacterium]
MLKAHGAAVLIPDETRRLAAQVFEPETGYLQREIVGQSAEVIARSTGIQRKYDIRLIVVPVPLQELSGAYGREKLAPILSLFTVNDEAEGLTGSRFSYLENAISENSRCKLPALLGWLPLLSRWTISVTVFL